MRGFVDIHSHVLPGIDDGPRDLDAALEMARAAAEAGTQILVATPHLRSDFPSVVVDEIPERCRSLSAEVDAAGIIGLRIVSGAETSLVWALEASDEKLAAASYGRRGKDILIETPDDVSTVEELLYRIRLRGLRITLAHPERSRVFQRDPDKLARLADQGILLQVNADALLAKPGSQTRRLAEYACREGLAQVIASDGHRAAEWRPVSLLAEGVNALTRLVGAPRAEWMARQAPAAIIGGGELPAAPEINAGSRSVWPFRRR